MEARRIILPPGGTVKLARAFKVSRKCVYEALTYRSNTQHAQMLRKAALENGGAEYDPDRRKRTH